MQVQVPGVNNELSLFPSVEPIAQTEKRQKRTRVPNWDIREHSLNKRFK